LLLCAVLLPLAGCTLGPQTVYQGPKGPPDKAKAARLRRHVQTLAGEIGERNHQAKPAALARAEAYVKEELEAAGHKVSVQEYPAGPGFTGRNYEAVIPALKPGAPVLVLGAHYDSADGTPGADDNASGVAVLLELARVLKPGPLELRLVAYGNEEPPYFWTPAMGSVHHAKLLKSEGRKVVGMVSLEMLGHYDDVPGSQKYPKVIAWLYPNTADFLGVVGTFGPSADFLKRFASGLKPPAGLKVLSSRLPRIIPEIGYSDNWSYWKEGLPAVMVTDTSFLRYPHYHTAQDTPDRLNYERMADAAAGIEAAVLSIGL
jgi:hypothetical protein